MEELQQEEAKREPVPEPLRVNEEEGEGEDGVEKGHIIRGRGQGSLAHLRGEIHHESRGQEAHLARQKGETQHGSRGQGEYLRDEGTHLRPAFWAFRTRMSFEEPHYGGHLGKRSS